MVKKIKELNIYDKVKFGRHQINEEEALPIIWRIVAKNHSCVPAYPSNSVTLHTDKIIDARPVDARELTNPDTNRTKYGNNRYLHTNLRQWINSTAKAGEWYKSQHEYDAPPDTLESINLLSAFYSQKPGFLHHFTKKEIDNILLTTIRVAKSMPVDGGDYEDIEDKIFFPSVVEVGLVASDGAVEGEKWEAYTDNESRISTMTQQCFENNKYMSVGSADTSFVYWLRTPVLANSASFRAVGNSGILGSNTSYQGQNGVRPALNLSGDTLVCDEPDSDGCYSVIFNDPPVINATPTGDLGVQTKPLKQTYTITDLDEDLLTVTEYLNDTVIRTLTDQQTGSKLTFDLTSQWQTLDLDTPYTATIEVTDGILTTTHEWTFTRSNAAPTITTNREGDLGKLAIPLKEQYIVDDPNMDVLTVVEKLDGQIINTLPAQPSGTKLTFDLTEQWPTLSKDSPHTAVIEVSDGLLTTTHTWAFSAIDPIHQGITVNPSSMQPTSINIPVLPVEVFVTNNASDPEPVWEDASEPYLKRKQYSFQNNTKTADDWRVAVKYTVNGASVPVKLITKHEVNIS